MDEFELFFGEFDGSMGINNYRHISVYVVNLGRFVRLIVNARGCYWQFSRKHKLVLTTRKTLQNSLTNINPLARALYKNKSILRPT